MNSILVHLMRHGIPERPNLLLGHRDDASLPSGVDQCVAASQGLEFAQVISSDLSRSTIPARCIATQRGIPHHIDPRWRELDFGAWTGLHPANIDPAAHALFWDDPDANPPPEGERWSQLCLRVEKALLDIRTSSLVITHGGAMRAAMRTMFQMDLRQVWAFDLPYSCILSLRVWPDADETTAQIIGLQS